MVQFGTAGANRPTREPAAVKSYCKQIIVTVEIIQRSVFGHVRSSQARSHIGVCWYLRRLTSYLEISWDQQKSNPAPAEKATEWSSMENLY